MQTKTTKQLYIVALQEFFFGIRWILTIEVKWKLDFFGVHLQIMSYLKSGDINDVDKVIYNNTCHPLTIQSCLAFPPQAF